MTCQIICPRHKSGNQNGNLCSNCCMLLCELYSIKRCLGCRKEKCVIGRINEEKLIHWSKIHNCLYWFWVAMFFVGLISLVGTGLLVDVFLGCLTVDTLTKTRWWANMSFMLLLISGFGFLCSGLALREKTNKKAEKKFFKLHPDYAELLKQAGIGQIGIS